MNDINIFKELPFTNKIENYPRLRIMGNKYKLLPWIASVFSELDFDTCLDAFSGSGCVSYLLKCMGKSVVSNDFLNFPYVLSMGLISNDSTTISKKDISALLKVNKKRERFISDTYNGIFYNPTDNKFLDNTWANLSEVKNSRKKALILSALIRACIKKQPRGVFTTRTAGNSKYDDGRRDLRITMKDQFLESIELLNSLIFTNEKKHRSIKSDIFSLDIGDVDLVYMDPPYFPRSDDNCYIKRYHFLEGISCYWKGQEVLETSVVKKIKKKYTPFSYRNMAIDTFQELFNKFKSSIIVLSYSSNGYPDGDVLLKLLEQAKGKDNVSLIRENHTYHFGSHGNVDINRKHVAEYLFIGA